MLADSTIVRLCPPLQSHPALLLLYEIIRGNSSANSGIIGSPSLPRRDPNGQESKNLLRRPLYDSAECLTYDATRMDTRGKCRP